MHNTPRATALAIALIALITSSAQASDTNYKVIKTVPQKWNACRDAAKVGWDSGVTNKMRTASMEYNECLKTIGVEVANEYYPPEAFGDNGFKAKVEEMQKASGKLYWGALNECKDCSGTMYHVMWGGMWAADMEQLLESMVDRILSEASDETVESFGSKWQDQWNKIRAQVRGEE
jgi:opacity protein-like surface antigen